jgi:hypothetical protein
MAQVDLWLREADEGDLPPLCVRCGAPAEIWKNRTAFVGLGGLPLISFPALTKHWSHCFAPDRYAW